MGLAQDIEVEYKLFPEVAHLIAKMVGNKKPTKTLIKKIIKEYQDESNILIKERGGKPLKLI